MLAVRGHGGGVLSPALGEAGGAAAALLAAAGEAAALLGHERLNLAQPRSHFVKVRHVADSGVAPEDVEERAVVERVEALARAGPGGRRREAPRRRRQASPGGREHAARKADSRH